MDNSTLNPLSHGLRVLMTVLHDMELNRPLYYFTLPGLLFIASGAAIGMGFLRDFYSGENIMFGPSLLMILLTLVGIFMAFTGIILHTLSRMINNEFLN